MSGIRVIRAGRTEPTKFVSPFQKSRQILILPSIKFVKRGRTDTRKIFVNPKCQSHGNKHHHLRAVREKGYV